MIDKLKDLIIIAGVGVVTLLIYLINSKNRKLGEIYYEKLSTAYEDKVTDLLKKHDNQIDIINIGDYNKLRLKYKDSLGRYQIARDKRRGRFVK